MECSVKNVSPDCTICGMTCQQIKNEMDSLRSQLDIKISDWLAECKQIDLLEDERNRLREALEKIYPSLPSYLGESETSDYPCLRRIADEALNAQAAVKTSEE